MKINLITKTFNEAKLVPYFFRHYDQFVDNYFIWDNISTDGTKELLEQKSNVLVFNNYDKEFDDYKHRTFKNEAWKSFTDCDWIINCDFDEFLYLKNIKEFLELELNAGIEILPVNGFQMFAEKLPTTSDQIYDEIKTGLRDSNYDKPIIFKPTITPDYSFGAHKIADNNFKWGFSGIKLLHYKFIGEDSIKSLLSRNSKLSERNLSEGLSVWSEEKGHRFNPYEFYKHLKQNSKEII